MSGYRLTDVLSLWWLGRPASPRLVGALRDDLPLHDGELLPAEAYAAAGAVEDARPVAAPAAHPLWPARCHSWRTQIGRAHV